MLVGGGGDDIDSPFDDDDDGPRRNVKRREKRTRRNQMKGKANRQTRAKRVKELERSADVPYCMCIEVERDVRLKRVWGWKKEKEKHKGKEERCLV